MIVTADANKGLAQPVETTAQVGQSAAQTQADTFSLLLSALASEVPYGVDLTALTDKGLGGEQSDPDTSPNAAWEGRLAAIVAAWLAQAPEKFQASLGETATFERGVGNPGTTENVANGSGQVGPPSASGLAAALMTAIAAGATRTSGAGQSPIAKDPTEFGLVVPSSASSEIAGLPAMPDSEPNSALGRKSGGFMGDSFMGDSFMGGSLMGGRLRAVAHELSAVRQGDSQTSAPEPGFEAGESLLRAFFSGRNGGKSGLEAEAFAFLSGSSLPAGGLGAGAVPAIQLSAVEQFLHPLLDRLATGGSGGRGSEVPTPLDLLAEFFAARLGRSLSVQEARDALEGAMRLEKSPRDVPEDGDPLTGRPAAHRFSEALGVEALLRAQVEAADGLLAASAQPSSSQFVSLTPALHGSGRETLANAAAIEGSVSWLASQHGGSATIDLSPPELGSMRIELKVDPAGTSATLVVHAANDAARVAVEQALDRLYEAFQNSGMSLSVALGSGSSSFGGAMPNFRSGGEDTQGALRGSSNARPNSRIEEVVGVAVVSGSDMLSLYA